MLNLVLRNDRMFSNAKFSVREMTEYHQKIQNKNKNQANLFFPSVQEHRDTLITNILLTVFKCYSYNHQPFSHVLLLTCDAYKHGAFQKNNRRKWELRMTSTVYYILRLY